MTPRPAIDRGRSRARVDELAPGLWRLGCASHNSYLLDLELPAGEGAAHWLWIDPGDRDTFQVLAEPARELMDGWERLALVAATGLGGGAVHALPVILERARRTLALMNWDTWNFVSVTGLPEERIRLAERFRPGLRLPGTGRSLRVIVNPYGQFTGSFLIFDPRSGCLFSGDLLACAPGAWQGDALLAEEADWPRIREHQERSMPCNAALRWTVERVRRLDGLVTVCPQNGPLLRGPVLERFLGRLEELPVGADLLTSGSAIPSGPELVLETGY